jgi:hypothetical protein
MEATDRLEYCYFGRHHSEMVIIPGGQKGQVMNRRHAKYVILASARTFDSDDATNSVFAIHTTTFVLDQLRSK